MAPRSRGPGPPKNSSPGCTQAAAEPKTLGPSSGRSEAEALGQPKTEHPRTGSHPPKARDPRAQNAEWMLSPLLRRASVSGPPAAGAAGEPAAPRRRRACAERAHCFLRVEPPLSPQQKNDYSFHFLRVRAGPRTQGAGPTDPRTQAWGCTKEPWRPRPQNPDPDARQQ